MSKDDFEKSFEKWIGLPQSKGEDVTPKDRPAFLTRLKQLYLLNCQYNEHLKGRCILYLDMYKKLKKENEELKNLNTALTEENNALTAGLGCDTCGIHLEFVNLNNQIDSLKEDLRNAKKVAEYAKSI